MLQLESELVTMRTELLLARSRAEIDQVIERREQRFRQLRPAARQLLISVVHRRLLEVPGG